jgi:hypothetical protein
VDVLVRAVFATGTTGAVLAWRIERGYRRREAAEHRRNGALRAP